MLHPPAERLEAYVEGALDDADRVVVDSHLVSCVRCQNEVEDWRSVFTALASLPHLEPTAGFADRVMAGVLVRQTAASRLAELLRRVVPGGTAGWVLATVLLALPVLVAGGAMAWLLSRPAITPTGLMLFVRDRLTDGFLSLAGQAGSALLESSAAQWLVDATAPLLGGLSATELGAAAALFAVLMVVSLWILYDNLLRNPSRENYNVTYCF